MSRRFEVNFTLPMTEREQLGMLRGARRRARWPVVVIIGLCVASVAALLVLRSIGGAA